MASHPGNDNNGNLHLNRNCISDIHVISINYYSKINKEVVAVAVTVSPLHTNDWELCLVYFSVWPNIWEPAL